ncbi:hypothetical protein M7I_1039 [Glarea lozoyensis 74030]|uniref:Uncharacterized protein n=1 Tax=Glarea lozoyensis (strain ATCC 74030 / MF5533) TaxID=1104152 RepID=H0EF02_GLAL7|nr:hypothetical protein M7I_1039 [Glarea lozoyensis 74030]
MLGWPKSADQQPKIAFSVPGDFVFFNEAGENWVSFVA